MAQNSGIMAKIFLATGAALFSSVLTTAVIVSAAATNYVETVDDTSHWNQHMELHSAQMNMLQAGQDRANETLKEIKNELQRWREKAGG